MSGEKGAYVAVTAIVALVLTSVYGLWMTKWSVPWTYVWDGIFTAVQFQSIIEGGWIFENSRLGMPVGHVFYDFPTTDLLHLIVIRAITLVVSDWATAYNIFFISTFFFTAGSAYWAGRKLGLDRGWAVAAAVLYVFLPYHYIRGQSHLFLSAYYAIPPIVVLCVWISQGVFSNFGTQKRIIGLSVFFSLMVSLSGVYYAFFACFLLVVAGVTGWLQFRRKLTPGIAGLCIITICLGIAVQLAPNFWYYCQEGRNGLVGKRSPVEAETHGLKVIQLLLPVMGHRVPILNEIANQYAAHAPLVAENRTAALGMVGGLGCVSLLGVAVLAVGRAEGTNSGVVTSLARLNLSAILLATIGGGGAVFAALISPQIRAYNRISVFIALFSLWAFFLLLQFVLKKWPIVK